MKLCWHKFGKWSEVIASVGGCSLHQVRCCEKCGVIKCKKTASTWTAYLHPHAVNNAIKNQSELKNEN
jgi:hypothetical protein